MIRITSNMKIYKKINESLVESGNLLKKIINYVFNFNIFNEKGEGYFNTALFHLNSKENK